MGAALGSIMASVMAPHISATSANRLHPMSRAAWRSDLAQAHRKHPCRNSMQAERQTSRGPPARPRRSRPVLSAARKPRPAGWRRATDGSNRGRRLRSFERDTSGRFAGAVAPDFRAHRVLVRLTPNRIGRFDAGQIWPGSDKPVGHRGGRRTGRPDRRDHARRRRDRHRAGGKAPGPPRQPHHRPARGLGHCARRPWASGSSARAGGAAARSCASSTTPAGCGARRR